MTAIYKKFIFIENSKIRTPKASIKQINPKKINLCKKYFYIKDANPMNLKKFNKEKYHRIMGNNKKAKGDTLEQVDDVIETCERKKLELRESRINGIRSLILNNKSIPERWILNPNYKDMLNEAMEEEAVLKFAILNKERHQKNAGEDQTDEERYLNYKKISSVGRKFISYINPYSRNFSNLSEKKKIMKNYCLSIERNNRNKNNQKKIVFNGLFNSYINNNKEMTKNNSVINILPEIKKQNRISKLNETNDEFMVTSLHYHSGMNSKRNLNNSVNDNSNSNDSKIKVKLPEIV